MTHLTLYFFPISRLAICKFLRSAIVSIFFLGIFLNSAHAQDNYKKITIADLKLQGNKFRAEIESTFLKMSKMDARRTYDLDEICNKYFPTGISFENVKIILRAAEYGASETSLILVPLYNHTSLSSDNPSKNDLAGGFLIEKSLMSNAIFQINFRPNISNKSKLEKVTSCGVITASL